ncbi:MAG: hypothetical protein MI867_28075 [Pseudomonadales bacterium]|nr:hypothetical protein [Pseudomonadales bacterium]
MKALISAPKTASLILTLALIVAATQTYAGINDRQAKQQARINHGIANGELTHREAARMQRQQNKIDRKEQAYRSDGVLTKRERIDLQTDLNQTSKRIYRQKHDAQSR